MNGINAIILAGGRSRRMGQDKARLQLGGEALLTRACRIAQAVIQPAAQTITEMAAETAAGTTAETAAGSIAVQASGKTEPPAPTAPRPSPSLLVMTAQAEHQMLLPGGWELLLETEPQGPLVAFALGLRQLQQHGQGDPSWVLLLACDLPLLTAEDLRQAVADLPRLSTDVDAYLPPWATAMPPSTGAGRRHKPIHWEPLCGFYRLRCTAALEVALARGSRAFQDWLDELNVEPLRQWPAEHLLNCNRPEDWARAQALYRSLAGDC